jgi:sugar lactone lactonase YvrE
MKAVIRFFWLVLVSLLVLPGTGTVIAAASTMPTTAGPAPGAGQAPVYLPLINQGYPLFNDAVSDFAPAASSGIFDHAFDATPDPDGNLIYFTATSGQDAGLFRVPATGGEVVTITVGTPLTLPLGLAISTSGQTLYVADPQAIAAPFQTAGQAGSAEPGANRGAIFSIPAPGGAATPVAGTAHTAPRGLEVAQENGADLLYFTGVDPSDGQPAVLKVAAAGGPLSIIVKGPPLVDPVGVAVGSDGTLYVTDQAAGGNGLGRVFRVTGGTVETIATSVRTGTPAGVALTLDESLLLVSALRANRDSSIVLVIDLADLHQGIVNQVIEANVGSGGLHRARNRNLMAWCGITAGGGGVVYRVELK